MEIDLDDLLLFDEFKEEETKDDKTVTPPTEDDDNTPPTPTDDDDVIGETDDETDDDETKEKDDETGDDDEGDSAETLKSYYEILKETNLIAVPEDFEFDGTEESLQKAFDITRQNQERAAAQVMWQNLPQDFKPLLEYALKGGTSLQDYLSVYSQSYDSLDPTNVEGQRKIMEAYYKATSKYSDERIQKMVNRLEDRGELEEEALDSLDELKTLREEEQAALMKRAEEEAADRALRTAKQVQLITESIDKMPDTGRRNKIKAFFFNAVERPDGGSTTEFDTVLSSIKDNPEHFVQLADILLEYDRKTGFNLDRYVKQGKTQATKKLSSLLEDKLNSKAKVKSKVSESTKKDDFDWSNYIKY